MACAKSFVSTPTMMLSSSGPCEIMRKVLRAHTVRGDVPMFYCQEDDGWLALSGAYLLKDA